ncbi:hypothetical protein QGM71_14765 [Virgibacillus sp. C22-A2]|uniref:Lipoprotein n=1 Tax=Virgibacillus tibetensis TaxID=3042313 RepID=A0ABU6KHF7_9BACI|nr:hypothetical protein [Virgibacillus sp. C22-A2]
MKKVIALFMILIILVGCNTELSFSEISLESSNVNVQFFFKGIENENGVHLYMDGEKSLYVFLNGKNVIQNEKAIQFSDFDVDSEGDTLTIYYTEEKTEDYSNDTLHHQIVYKIDKDKNYANVKGIKNGEEVAFGAVSGN